MRTSCRLLVLTAFSLMPMSSACYAVPTAEQPQPAEQPRQSSERTARLDLYQCDGCEAVLERNPANLRWRAAIPPPGELGEPLILRGTVYQSDGRSPASGVVVYAHHTDTAGLYAGGSTETEWSRRHGRLRGWVKTGPDGRYEFVTIKPAPYPTRTQPAHIHLTVLENGRRPYYIDEVAFAGEFGVDARYRRSRENRGSAGIVQLTRAPDGTWLAERNITLELHP